MVMKAKIKAVAGCANEQLILLGLRYTSGDGIERYLKKAAECFPKAGKPRGWQRPRIFFEFVT